MHKTGMYNQSSFLDMDKMDNLPDVALKEMTVDNAKENIAVPSESNFNGQDQQEQLVKILDTNKMDDLPDIALEDMPVGNENEISESDDSDGWTESVSIENRLTGNTDTILHPTDVRNICKVLSVAPGEGQTPLGLYQDTNAEYLAFPTIYCGQKRPENKERKTPVHYSTICRWELRCF